MTWRDTILKNATNSRGFYQMINYYLTIDNYVSLKKLKNAIICCETEVFFFYFVCGILLTSFGIILR